MGGRGDESGEFGGETPNAPGCQPFRGRIRRGGNAIFADRENYFLLHSRSKKICHLAPEKKQSRVCPKKVAFCPKKGGGLSPPSAFPLLPTGKSFELTALTL